MKVKKAVSRVLIGFVLVSIGFVVGKEVTLRSVRTGGASPAATQPAGSNRVIVYYMHGTVRCVTCNRIEKMAAELVDSQFARARQDGRLVWREVNFQEDEQLAKRYDVASSCVVVVKVRDGREVDFRRVDEVWTLADKPEEFNACLTGAIRAYLGEGEA